MCEHGYTTMVDHCKEVKPLEGCGLLFGKGEVITTVIPMVNENHSPVSFSIRSEALEAVMKERMVRGEQWLGVFHSHPTAPAIPSETDRLMMDDESLCYIIVSLALRQPDVRGYVTEGSQLVPARITLQPKESLS